MLSEGEIKRVEEAVARLTGRAQESERGFFLKIEVDFCAEGKKVRDCTGRMCDKLWSL